MARPCPRPPTGPGPAVRDRPARILGVYLPSHAELETLFNFANDFYALITRSIHSVGPAGFERSSPAVWRTSVNSRRQSATAKKRCGLPRRSTSGSISLRAARRSGSSLCARGISRRPSSCRNAPSPVAASGMSRAWYPKLPRVWAMRSPCPGESGGVTLAAPEADATEPADVVAHDDQDVGRLRRRLCGRQPGGQCRHRGRCEQNNQGLQLTFLRFSPFVSFLVLPHVRYCPNSQ